MTTVYCLSYFAPRRRRIQRQKGPVMQLHGITLSFHRQMYVPSHNRGRYEALFGCTPAPRPRCAVEPRNVAETTKVAFVGGMMAGSGRLAVFLVRLVINWQHLAKGTSCKRDGSAGDEG
jgi:hypothetical protein